MKTKNLLMACLMTLTASAHAQGVMPRGVMPDLERQTCREDRARMVKLHQTLSKESEQLNAESAALETSERGLQAQQAAIAAARADLMRQREALDASGTVIISEETMKDGNVLDSQLRGLTEFRATRKAFSAQVDAYNEGVRQQQARLDRYNTQAQTLNTQLARYDAEAKTIDARCVTGEKTAP